MNTSIATSAASSAHRVTRPTAAFDPVRIAEQLAPKFAARAPGHDAEGTFVADNYADLAGHRMMSALVPVALGGGGASVTQVADALRVIAHGCASTALALSMHQHLVAAMVWKFRNKGEAKPVLEKTAAEQLVFVSTGASDWIDSNGSMRKVPGGYRVTARKVFSSGCEVANMMLTTARYDDPEEGALVLHFPVPYDAEGVRITGDWDTLGLRGTGSHTVLLDDVFVPEEKIGLRRPRDAWHPAWSVVLVGALPILMSPYVGIAEAARELAVAAARGKRDLHHLPYLVAELDTALETARMARREMLALHADYAFAPTLESASRALMLKTLCANACIAAVEKAMEVAGGRGFFKSFPLERLLRDVHGAPYHPLPEKKQQLFSGRLALGLDPLDGAPITET